MSNAGGKANREKGARVERELAKALGWKRGRAFTGEPDMYMDVAGRRYYVASVKARARWPAWIEDAVADAQRKADGQAEPIVVLVRRRKGAEPIVLMAHIGVEGWIDAHGTG